MRITFGLLGHNEGPRISTQLLVSMRITRIGPLSSSIRYILYFMWYLNHNQCILESMITAHNHKSGFVNILMMYMYMGLTTSHVPMTIVSLYNPNCGT